MVALWSLDPKCAPTAAKGITAATAAVAHSSISKEVNVASRNERETVRTKLRTMRQAKSQRRALEPKCVDADINEFKSHADCPQPCVWEQEKVKSGWQEKHWESHLCDFYSNEQYPT